MKEQELGILIREAWTALSPHYENAIECIIDESGLEGRVWGVLLAVLTFEPELTTPAHLLVRIPYTSADLYLERLKSAAQAGYLEEVEPGKFRLSLLGQSELNHFIIEARNAMSCANPLSFSESIRLTGLLEKLVQSCLDTEPPPGRWSIRHSFKLMPSKDPPMPYIEQAFSCLSAYRDDAHLAAWKQSGLSATALETLTLLWRGDVHSLDLIVEKLEYRGHSLWVYADALAELRECGYISGSDDKLEITPTGKYFREHVESDTDGYFFSPWSCLSDSEKVELGELLINLRDGLNETVPSRKNV
jgi:hypothetical protein